MLAWQLRQRACTAPGDGPVRQKKNPAEAGLKFRDERAQRVWELVPNVPMRNACRRFRIFHKKLRADIPREK
jgi:hypothetical protein